MTVRRRSVLIARVKARVLGMLLALSALVLVGLGAGTCVDYYDGLLWPCDDDDDCAFAPRMTCIEGMCVCSGPDVVFCQTGCKLRSECDLYNGGAAGSGAGGAGGTGGVGGVGGMSVPVSECMTAAECPQPGDARCGKATCADGVCRLELTPLSRLASQLAGDCKERWCDGAGNLIEFTEGTDSYNDGLPCTVNDCEAGEPVTTLVPNGNTCPAAGSGVCNEGACVPCIQDLVGCGGNLVCISSQCIAMHCINKQWDQGSGETSVDCGGTCAPCLPGHPCNVGSDCLSGVCTTGSCQPPTCSDSTRNDSETGIDCGGPPNCPRCPSGQGCKAPSDCVSGVCWAGVCESPSCKDGVTNGEEIGEDCGGPCEACP